MKNDFPKGLLSWLQSYLNERTSVVRVHHTVSQPFKVARGIPHGTALGPALFACYVHDLHCSRDNSFIVKYADDMSIVTELKLNDPSYIKECINDEVKNINQWCDENYLKLNLDKSSFLLNSRTEVNITPPLRLPQCDVIKILGVQINSRLDWSSHIETLERKANQQFHALKLINSYVSPDELHIVYTTTIRSLLEYCSPAFVKLPAKLSLKLQRIDNRAHRIIYGENEFKCTCEKEYLKKRRTNQSVKLLRDAERNNSHPLHELLPDRLPRTNQFRLPFSRTQRRQDSFLPHVLALMNNHR